MATKVDLQPVRLARFVERVADVSRTQPDRRKAIDVIHPLFAEMLSEPDWLAEEHQVPVPGKFAQYLVYREEDRSLSVMAMVVPTGTTTPVHDHLAWGLVGVYQGRQQETVYRRTDGAGDPAKAVLVETERNVLNVGDITHLVPPEGDIHKIETISEDQTSISIHILGNDIGCQWRHAFDVEKQAAYDFRSGYVNAPCHDQG
jgi:predicted metal-dependent enzyme (double-stranded beta helix superfamily)